MATSALSARLKYLNESTRALALLAPVTSSSMGAEIGRLARDHRLKMPESYRNEICAACGSVFIPGNSCTVSVKPQRVDARSDKIKMSKLKSAKASNNSTVKLGKIVLRTCLRCGRRTRSASLPPKPVTNVKKRSEISAKTPTSTVGNGVVELAHQGARTIAEFNGTSKTPSGHPGSKQRARARKQGGLSAMLAKNKAAGASEGGTALNLMDFMKFG